MAGCSVGLRAGFDAEARRRREVVGWAVPTAVRCGIEQSLQATIDSQATSLRGFSELVERHSCSNEVDVGSPYVAGRLGIAR